MAINFVVTSHGVRSMKTLKPRFPFASVPEFQKVLLIDDIFKRRAISTSAEKVFFELEHPSDGDEFVDWMHHATAGNAVLNGISADFADIGSLTSFNATDPRQPGCGTPNIKIQRAYRNGGIAVASGQQFNIPPNKAVEIIAKDVLGWAAILWSGRIQWVTALLEWLKLGIAKFADKNVRFAEFRGQPSMMPFKVASNIKSPILVVAMTTVTDRPTSYTLEGRNINDFRQSLFKSDVEIPEGENTTLYFVNGIPFVDEFLLTVKPKIPVVGAITKMETIPF